MRDIKFRGKDVNGNWVFGNLHVHKNTHDSSKNLYYIIRPCFVPALTMPADNYIEVDPETVGQYTGVKDVNGLDIYEGDIIEHQSNGLFQSVVSWGKKSHAWTLKTDRTKELWGKVKYYKLPVSKCIKVIGNIHTNE